MLDVVGGASHHPAPSSANRVSVIGVYGREVCFQIDRLLLRDTEHAIGFRRPFHPVGWNIEQPAADLPDGLGKVEIFLALAQVLQHDHAAQRIRDTLPNVLENQQFILVISTRLRAVMQAH